MIPISLQKFFNVYQLQMQGTLCSLGGAARGGAPGARLGWCFCCWSCCAVDVDMDVDVCSLVERQTSEHGMSISTKGANKTHAQAGEQAGGSQTDRQS